MSYATRLLVAITCFWITTTNVDAERMKSTWTTDSNWGDLRFELVDHGYRVKGDLQELFAVVKNVSDKTYPTIFLTAVQFVEGGKVLQTVLLPTERTTFNPGEQTTVSVASVTRDAPYQFLYAIVVPEDGLGAMNAALAGHMAFTKWAITTYGTKRVIDAFRLTR